MKIYKKISINLLAAVLLLSPVVVLAQPSTQIGSSPSPSAAPTTIKIPNPFKGGTDLMSFITSVLNNIIMPIAAVGVVVWIVWAGFQFVLAQGKPDAIKKARDNLMWSLIGAGILLGAAAISVAVKSTIEALIR